MKKITKPLPRHRRIQRGKLAMRLQREGMSLKNIGKRWDVTDMSVMRWIKEAQDYEARGRRKAALS